MNSQIAVMNRVKKHTLEYSSSSKLYKSMVKQESGIGSSAIDKVLVHNNSEEDYFQHRGSSDLRVQNIVYVLNMRGQPLMPSTQQKVNKLLKNGKAKVIKRNPFTIQLQYATGENKQLVTLGIDPGYNNIGFSAITNKKELISGQVKLINNIGKKLTTRRMYRKLKRSRLWYREPRFLNRIKSKKKGWLAPSIQYKLDTHIRLINKIKELFPISKIIIEVANFDTQKMQNPEIKGIEYQQGTLQGYETKEYLLEKFNRKCVYCGKSNIPLQIEHIIPKSRGGSNRVSNLAISCEDCNLKKGNQTAEEFGYPNIQKQAKHTLKSTACMNNIRWRLVNLLNCQWAYGYVTKYNRSKLKLPKSHINDAFVIANGNGQIRSKEYDIKQIRRNNRRLERLIKGKRRIRKQRYKFQPNDLVKYENSLWRVVNTTSGGKSIGITSKNSIKKYPNPKNVELVNYGKGLCYERSCDGN